FYDPGALWHIKVGELILADGLPHTDPFTYTFAGRPWVPMQWAAETGMAVAHRAGGLDTLLLAFATLVAALFTLIFHRATQSGMGPILAALVVGGALFVGAFHFLVRPHMLTVALLGWTMICLADFDRGRAGLGRMAGLVPVFVLWTNLHGGVIGGMATVALAVGGWAAVFLAQRLLDRSTANAAGPPLNPWRVTTSVRNWRTLVALVAVAVACVLSAFVNPFGLELLRMWDLIVRSKVIHDVISEHHPLDPSSA